jgi:hypothetical protein
MLEHEVIGHELGEADLAIGGLRIWAHSRKYPTSSNFWDVNWLNTTFECRTPNSSVIVSGDILHTTEIAEWIDALETFTVIGAEEITLPTLERFLCLTIKSETLSRISANVEISADSIFERHSYSFWMDQCILPEIVDGLRGILQRFPIGGNNKAPQLSNS